MPPASGVIVSAAALPAGFLTVKTEFSSVVVIMLRPTIALVPVARPTTVYARSAPFKVNKSCPASLTPTLNKIW